MSGNSDTERDRFIAAAASGEDAVFDRAIRPKRLVDYVGQSAV
jgi:Holliday junction resolvasome RuvABC ATP-dependent DNA helicase subunit